MPQRIILTGATGMVGEGVLLTCLAQPEVEAVLVVGRRACGHAHPKLREVLVPDFFDLQAIEPELVGYMLFLRRRVVARPSGGRVRSRDPRPDAALCPHATAALAGGRVLLRFGRGHRRPADVGAG